MSTLTPRRPGPRWGRPVALVAAATLGLVGVIAPFAQAIGSVGTAAGFEDDDANLTAATTTDWNSFQGITWTGTAPTRQAGVEVIDGWSVKGLEDWQASTTDSGFSGGVKQDDVCPALTTAKADNKADLKRAYIAAKTVDGHTYLMLAWARIPQNTTSASAHVAFEFTKGSVPCGGNSGTLVQRTAGDLLVVYDFEGGGGDPVIHLSRWITTNTATTSGQCDIGSHNAPCWNTAVTLTAGQAEAKVNVDTAVLDTLAPPTGVAGETLGLSEFGEAGIDLTNAGVFPANTCQSFGSVYAVSRTSGNSGTAQMKDLVGPGAFALSNCTSTTVTTPTLADGSAIPAAGVSIGTSASLQVRDSAVISVSGGSNLSPTGSVAFWLCQVAAPGLCTSGGTSVGSATVTGSWTVSSPTATVTSAGRYCWRAEYSGDPTAGLAGSSDASSSECFTVTPVTPTLSTQASSGVIVGQQITDVAALAGTALKPASPVINPASGATRAVATGTITFSLFDASCSGSAIFTSIKVVSGDGNYTSDPYTTTAPGTYHWVASYSGDQPNTLGVDHNTDCSQSAESVTVTTVASSLSSAQTWLPNDSATVSAPDGGQLAGSVTFEFFASADCSTPAVWSQTVTVAGPSPQTVGTSNTVAVSATGSFAFRVAYDSTNPAQRDIAASCHETSALTIANGGSVSSAP